MVGLVDVAVNLYHTSYLTVPTPAQVVVISAADDATVLVIQVAAVNVTAFAQASFAGWANKWLEIHRRRKSIRVLPKSSFFMDGILVECRENNIRKK